MRMPANIRSSISLIAHLAHLCLCACVQRRISKPDVDPGTAHGSHKCKGSARVARRLLYGGDPISSRDPYGHNVLLDVFFDAATGAMTEGAAAAVQGESVGGGAAEGGVVGGATAAIPGGTPAKAAAGAVAGAATADPGDRAAGAFAGAAGAAAPAEAGFGAAEPRRLLRRQCCVSHSTVA
jgi:hypothetical protein